VGTILKYSAWFIHVKIAAHAEENLQHFGRTGAFVVNVSEIVPVFLEACPGLASPWQEHLSFWEGEADRGEYNDVAVIADYLVNCFEACDLSEFPAAFTVLEKCLGEGDDEAIEVTTIGIVEGIQIVASHRPFGPEVFEQWMGPRARLAWLVGIATWGCQFTLANWLRIQLRSKERRFAELDLELTKASGMHDIVVRLYPG
jgi:hypothetical protein